jgi:hypothetical protein
MEPSMQDFIREENLKLYRRALANSTDAEQRKVLLVLLQLLVAERAAATLGPNLPASSNGLNF